MEIFKLDGKRGSVIVSKCEEEDDEENIFNNLNEEVENKRKYNYNCTHGKSKYNCKECNKSYKIKSTVKCEHNKVKYNCQECGGSGICQHRKQKRYCKECRGSYICEHGKRKDRCKECGGSGICEHGKRKRYCKECGGSGICEHDKVKYSCKECGGYAYCEHGRIKSQCKECGGVSICEHGRVKSRCKECGGNCICEHGKRKYDCKDCGGSTYCEHGKEKRRCKECGGSALCKSSWCETSGISKYNGYCMPCCVQLFPEIEVSRNYKTKEKGVAEKVLEAFPDFTWITDKRIEDGCSRRRPDLLLDMGSHIIIVEVDENQHNDYDCSCENKRLMEISQDVGHRPIVFIRFNPDEYINEKGKKIKSCWKYNKNGVMKVDPKMENEWESRIKCLLEQIKYWVENPTEKTVEVVQLFYSLNT